MKTGPEARMFQESIRKFPIALTLSAAVIFFMSALQSSANFGGIGVESGQQKIQAQKTGLRKIASEPDRSRLIQALQENDLVQAKKLISEIPEFQTSCRDEPQSD